MPDIDKTERTIIVQKGESGYLVGQLKEYPTVMSQGKTIDEFSENIKDTLQLYFTFNPL